MVGKKDRSPSLFAFVPGDLTDFIPEEHILRRVARVVNLSWVRDEVRDAYCSDNGAPSIDPEVVIRLLIVGFLFDIIHIRELLREVQVNLAMRWFVGYGLDERLPNHSSLSKIADRWGEERFKRIYQRVVRMCVDAGLVDGKKVHIDATLIRANVSWESLVAVPVESIPAGTATADDSGTKNLSLNNTCITMRNCYTVVHGCIQVMDRIRCSLGACRITDPWSQTNLRA
jgi:transposase